MLLEFQSLPYLSHRGDVVAVIITDGLTKYYGEQRGIENLTLQMNKGEILGFIGPNGAGKSTTIRLLLNFVFPTAGEASVLGYDVVEDALEIRRRVGYLPSECHYYPEMTGEVLLEYAERFYRKDCSKRRQELAELLDLDLSKRTGELSFGNRKKLGIIQAMQHCPELLILDEPTGGLDPLMQEVFLDMVREEKELGVSVFFSSHILSEVQKISDRVAIIKEGTLIKMESIKGLLSDQFKRVTIEWRNDKTNDLKLAGLTEQDRQGNISTFIFRGDIRDLVAALGGLELLDLRIEEPSLEEVFLHYYDHTEVVL